LPRFVKQIKIATVASATTTSYERSFSFTGNEVKLIKIRKMNTSNNSNNNSNDNGNGNKKMSLHQRQPPVSSAPFVVSVPSSSSCSSSSTTTAAFQSSILQFPPAYKLAPTLALTFRNSVNDHKQD
jgi:hypothetical protein